MPRKNVTPTRQLKLRVSEDLYQEVHRLLECPVASEAGPSRKKFGELSALGEQLFRQWVESQRKTARKEG